MEVGVRRAGIALKPIAQGSEKGKKRRVLRATQRHYANLADPASDADATAWRHTITTAESEGMVIKPVERRKS